MKKIITCSVLFLIVFVLPLNSHAKRKEKVRIIGGTAIPRYGMAIDLSYDPRFDTLVPGYKVVQVAIVNNSFNMIGMDPQKDKWTVFTGGGKKRYPAITDLSTKDREAWAQLPEEARKIISYPLILPIGARKVIDLFVPSKAPLETLKGVLIDIKSLDTKFEVIARN